MNERTTPRTTTRRGRLIAVIALAAALAIPTALIASPPCGGQGRGHGDADAPRAMRMLHGLELEPAQRETIMELFEDSRAGLDATHEAARAIRDEMRTAAHAEPFDEAALRDAAGRLAAVEADLAVGRARTMQLVREQLTDDQRDELDQRMAERAERGDRRPEGSHRPRRGPAQGRGGF